MSRFYDQGYLFMARFFIFIISELSMWLIDNFFFLFLFPNTLRIYTDAHTPNQKLKMVVGIHI